MGFSWMSPYSLFKRKSAFEDEQNAQIQIILRMGKLSSGPLVYIPTFCTIQWFC